MKQPKLYLFSKLTNIKENKRFLLDSFDFKSIRDAKKNEKFKNLKADEIYSILFTDYNNDIDESNELMKKNYEKKIKQFKKKEVIKNATGAHPRSTKTKTQNYSVHITGETEVSHKKDMKKFIRNQLMFIMNFKHKINVIYKKN